MKKTKIKVETFIPALLRAVERNGGILDIWQAQKTFGMLVVKLALKREDVTEHVIVFNIKNRSPLRIPCITLDWDGKRPTWLDLYKQNEE